MEVAFFRFVLCVFLKKNSPKWVFSTFFSFTQRTGRLPSERAWSPASQYWQQSLLPLQSPHFQNDFSLLQSIQWKYTSTPTHSWPPLHKHRLLSAMNSLQFVPIRARQKMAISRESFSRGTWAISQAVINGSFETRSKLCTSWFLHSLYIFPSPQPKSPTRLRGSFLMMSGMQRAYCSIFINTSTGTSGQRVTCSRKPWW